MNNRWLVKTLNQGDRGEKQNYSTGEIPRDYELNEADVLIAVTEQAAGLHQAYSGEM